MRHLKYALRCSYLGILVNYWPYLHYLHSPPAQICASAESVAQLGQLSLLQCSTTGCCGFYLFFIRHKAIRPHYFPFFIFKFRKQTYHSLLLHQKVFLTIESIHFDLFSEHADLLNPLSLKESDWRAVPVIGCIMSCSLSKSGANCIQIVSTN